MHTLEPGTRFLHIKCPNFPQFRFEWHPGTKRVYVIRVGAKPEIGEPIAFEVDTHGAAHNAVLIWLRGYRQRSLEIDQPRELLSLT